MRTTLRALMAVLGVGAIIIALSIFFAGAQATVAGGEFAYHLITGWHGPPSPPWPPSMDSELRFYAPFWGAYGVLLLRAVAEPARLRAWTPWLVAVFFAGGVGRAISHSAVGAPHPFFNMLMVIELVTPPVMIALWLGQRRAG